MFNIDDQVICTSKTIKSLTYDRVYTVRWVSRSQILVNNDTGCGYYYSKEHFKKMEKDMENVRVGDIVRCINNTHASGSLIRNRHYEVVGVSTGLISVKNDNGETRYYPKSRFEVAARANLWVGGSKTSDHVENLRSAAEIVRRSFQAPNDDAYDALIKMALDFQKPLGINGKIVRNSIIVDELKKGEKDNVNNIKKLHKDIKNIYFNEKKRTTVIVFKNGDKVKATASKDTPFSEYAGFVTALFKYEHDLKLDDVEHLIKKKRG